MAKKNAYKIEIYIEGVTETLQEIVGTWTEKEVIAYTKTKLFASRYIGGTPIPPEKLKAIISKRIIVLSLGEIL